MKFVFVLVVISIVCTAGYAQGGCCWNGDCCQGVEFCCDDCNGSCTCSVNGKCSTEQQQRDVAAATEAFDRFKKVHKKRYASKEEETKRFGVFFSNLRGVTGNKTSKALLLPSEADQRKLNLETCYGACNSNSDCNQAGSCPFCYVGLPSGPQCLQNPTCNSGGCNRNSDCPASCPNCVQVPFGPVMTCQAK